MEDTSTRTNTWYTNGYEYEYQYPVKTWVKVWGNWLLISITWCCDHNAEMNDAIPIVLHEIKIAKS